MYHEASGLLPDNFGGERCEISDRVDIMRTYLEASIERKEPILYAKARGYALIIRRLATVDSIEGDVPLLTIHEEACVNLLIYDEPNEIKDATCE